MTNTEIQNRIFLEPIEYVIHVFRGVRATARAIGRDASTISNWRKKPSKCIPAAVRRTILEVAKERGLEITSHHLDYGREITCDDYRIDYQRAR